MQVLSLKNKSNWINEPRKYTGNNFTELEKDQLQPKLISISNNKLRKIVFLYLLIPFVIFCFGFLRIYIAAPLAAVLFWLVVKHWNSGDESTRLSIPIKKFWLCLLLVFLWVALSGIGGFGFQNTDFHTRNAIFHDLINLPWPVRYHTNLADPTISYSLTYYIGFWLPAALVGKIAGWQAANIALYLWSVIGILLTIFILSNKIKNAPLLITMLLIFFSGMDGLGVLLRMLALPNLYKPTLWPPIQHLEWWASGFQYSSFTTQLFWVFNQAIPAWICMALLITSKERKSIFFIWSLCCFFAPLPAIGMLPYVFIKIPEALFNPENIKENRAAYSTESLLQRGLKDISSLFTVENILGGGLILVITYLYFSGNVHVSDQTVNTLPAKNWIIYPIFVILEGFFLWTLFKANQKANLYWYLAGVLILLIPFIKIGNGQDFCMRASIPTLFMLLIFSADLLKGPKSQTRTFLVILLCIGAITPIFEINRSIYRIADYFLNPPTQAEAAEGQQVKIYDPTSFEYDHPYTLVADSFHSLANYDPDVITNFVAKENHSIFETYIEK
jgi:hypothetical protein